MCTTACMHIAMGILCGKLHLKDEISNSSMRDCLNLIMQISSNAHAGLEEELGNSSITAQKRMRRIPRMVSVNEIVRECGLDTKRLGIRMEELFVVAGSQEGSQETSTIIMEKQMDDKPPQHGSEEEVVMKYRASSCFISPNQIARCLVTSARDRCSAALVTGNGHTVCLVYYWEAGTEGRYAFFDPFTGTMITGLDVDSGGLELVEMIGTALNIDFTKRTTIKDDHCCDITLMYNSIL
jgi:hypothetical protein